MTLISDARDRDAAASSATVRTTDYDTREAVVTLRGDVDLSSCALLRTEFEQHLSAGRCTIRIDAGDVTFLDCRALGELVRAGQRCRAAAGTLVLTRASRPVQRLLQLTGMQGELVAARRGTAAEPQSG